MKAHEHYHIGLEAGIIAILIWPFLPFASIILLGVMVGFVLKESEQKNDFALNSGHFKNSSIIGIILTVILVAVALLL